VETQRVLDLDKGVFMVSVDLELAWGFNYELLLGSRTAEKYLKIIRERSRRNVKRLLDLAEKFNIPFTWGVVGHLFLSSCDRSDNGCPHCDMPRPKLNVRKDWYANDPCSNLDREPLWYATDLIKQILESKVEHDIACHSFSHVDFSKCSREVALSEVRKCKEVMKKYCVDPKSFIFPKNRVGHLNVLKQEGFKTFRIKMNHTSNSLIDLALETLFPTVGVPIQVNGLLGIPSSLLFQSSHNIHTLRLLISARRGIERAVNEKRIFHIIMHDYIETNYLLKALSKLLSYAVKLRDKEKLDIVSMVELYEKI
jgi:peptidoglycan/xylan/chitin deacetylase (PgdA/CDA1 family)